MLFCILMFGFTFASEKEKSVAMAALLGLDPIPGDALFYAGRPIQGAVNSALGLLGLGLIFVGSGLSGLDEDQGIFSNTEDARLEYAVLGFTLYLPVLIWDLAGGIAGTILYNERVKMKQEKNSLLLHPELTIAKDSAKFGLSMNF